MHLAYLDDSDTKKRCVKLQVVSGVIIEDKDFKMIEIAMRGIRDELVPIERQSDFQEFHACELYGGHGVFKDIPQEKRFNAISSLLSLLDLGDGLSVVYGAVDIQKQQSQIYGSADPLDTAFRICMKEVCEWVQGRAMRIDFRKDADAAIRVWLQELVILIVDECDQKQRHMLQSSFRTLRHPLQADDDSQKRIPHIHDDMFFGDSRYSVGIQLADLCSYFIARHLEGDAEIDHFYEMIEPHIVYGQLYPDEAEFSKPQPMLKNLLALQSILALEQQHEEQGVSELQSGDGQHSPSESESGEGGDGAGEKAERDRTQSEGRKKAGQVTCPRILIHS